MRSRSVVGAAAAAVFLLAGTVATATDFPIALNFNWNGNLNPGEGGNADNPAGFRSISDRALSLDGGGNSLGTSAIVGSTGVTYSVVLAADTLDIVHLGDTGTSGVANPPAGSPARMWDTAVGNIANRGIQPTWMADIHRDITPQVTTLATPLLLDANSTVSFLYYISNSGGAFDVVLGFSDSTSVTVNVTGADWFGPTNPAAPLASSGVASQTRLANTTYQGTSNQDTGTVQTWPTQALAVSEAIVTVQSLISSGRGNIAGKTLTSITFQNPVPNTRGYAIMASTVVTGLGPPANDNCAVPMTVLAGSLATDNLRATGATTTACGQGDTTDVWYRYVASATGPVEVRTCGASFDTTAAVYTTCGGAAIACNNNGCGLASRVRWNAVAAQAYLIRIAGNNAATGQFTLEVDPNPTGVHTDTPVALATNWNGLVHVGEDANPDAANGYRSIADRGLHTSGTMGALNAGACVGTDFIPYAVINDPGVLDIIHLGTRAFNTVVGDNIGNQPAWLPGGPDQPGPVRSDTAAYNAFMGPNTRIGVIYQVAIGPGTIDMTLDFSDSSTVTVALQGPDWYLDNSPDGPSFGVEVQRQLGLFNATRDNDTASLGAPGLNVVEAVVSTSSLQGFGDFTNKRLTGISFSNRNPATCAVAIMAVTVRDALPPTGPVSPFGSGVAVPSSVPIGQATLLKVTVSPGLNPMSTGLGVHADLSSINGNANQLFYDNGTNGDVTAGDNVFSYAATLAEPLSPNTFTLPFTVTDAQSRTGTGNITVTGTDALTGRCCTGGNCSISSQFQCTSGGGTYGGDGTNCAGQASTPFASSDSFPIAIPDFANGVPGTASSSVTIVNGGSISNLAVKVGLTHTYMGDLIGTISNGTTTVTLFNRVGGTNEPNGSYVFFDLAPTPFTTAAGTNPITPGDYQPGESLSAFDNQSFVGTWTLTITDNAGIDTGTITSFAIGSAAQISCGPVCGTADFDGDGDTGTDFDIEAFFACLSGNCCPTCFPQGVDFNGDGDSGTDLDIESFFAVLAGGTCHY